MTLMPLLEASPAIQVHFLAAVFAVGLGGAQLLMRRGTRRHRWAGRAWAALMGVIALSSFFIHEIRLLGPWSPIHILSIFTLIMLAVGVNAARKGRHRSHGITMACLYIFALLGAGAFTFVPGRLMHTVIIGG